jgi:protein involved in polysaccharide export with SLBB domain
MLVSGEGMKRVLGGLLLALSLVMSALVVNAGLGLAQVQAQAQTKSQFVPLVGVSQSQSQNQMGAPMNAQVSGAEAVSAVGAGAGLDYVLAPNDRVRLMVFGEADLSGEFVIDSAGMASLPLVGEVPAAGMNLRTFQREVERRLKNGYLVDPRVSAQILNFRPIFVLGEVKIPGEHPFASGLTLLNAVAQAGGFTPLANTQRVFVRREGSPEEEELVVRSGVPVMPGDTVRIEKSAMFIYGEVRTQGEMPIPPGLTVRTAVAQAGGFGELADTQTVFVKRAGSEQEIAVPFDSGALVQSGDTLRVDKSSFFIMGEVAKTGELPMRPGLSVTNAAILAGGFTTRADTRTVFIRRAGETKEKRYRLTNDLVVQKGDTIRIPERFF